METPTSSSRTIPRSQALVTRKIEESEKRVLKSRSALIDISNDSPIVGLAVGNMKTPSSTFYKKRMTVRESEEDESKYATTPGSGEALLRDQVQTLLQKVEEEALIKKITFEPKNFGGSLMYVVAPTPANTPQLSENNNNGSESLAVSPVGSESFDLSQEEEIEEGLEKNVITKLLFRDFPERLEGYDSSLDDEDDESVWSVEVNASTTSEEHEVDEEFEVGYVDEMVDELCEVMIKICVDDCAKYSGCLSG
ncbi:uncharacterized protein LOC110918186 [Helianthus annuus]|uniref:uncharacterized protein LOC110918186 n=1 Tax=Helianthus annuus TaxID=4232 RepID=UPI000B8EF0C3|nr:uncharacterized protein LOC110918186 [Helianthus annuus]